MEILDTEGFSEASSKMLSDLGLEGEAQKSAKRDHNESTEAGCRIFRKQSFFRCLEFITTKWVILSQARAKKKCKARISKGRRHEMLKNTVCARLYVNHARLDTSS